MPSLLPRPYPQWRTNPVDRAEDAAYTFGFHLMLHCRAEALKILDDADLPPDSPLHGVIENAIDTALHNCMDLFEGFWTLRAGPDHQVRYVVSVQVSDNQSTILEEIDISPSKIDLPIGYWAWKSGHFQ